jgi:hypothetical protein
VAHVQVAVAADTRILTDPATLNSKRPVHLLTSLLNRLQATDQIHMPSTVATKTTLRCGTSLWCSSNSKVVKVLPLPALLHQGHSDVSLVCSRVLG